jgi:hypothetical protein
MREHRKRLAERIGGAEPPRAATFQCECELASAVYDPAHVAGGRSAYTHFLSGVLVAVLFLVVVKVFSAEIETHQSGPITMVYTCNEVSGDG